MCFILDGKYNASEQQYRNQFGKLILSNLWHEGHPNKSLHCVVSDENGLLMSYDCENPLDEAKFVCTLWTSKHVYRTMKSQLSATYSYWIICPSNFKNIHTVLFGLCKVKGIYINDLNYPLQGPDTTVMDTFENTLFWFGQSKATFEKAKDLCDEQEAHLLTYKSTWKFLSMLNKLYSMQGITNKVGTTGRLFIYFFIVVIHHAHRNFKTIHYKRYTCFIIEMERG